MAQFNGKVTSLVENVAHMMGRAGAAFTDGWFGPSAPLEATAPKEVAGRQFDYTTGYNINSKPRQGEVITFDLLRSFADSYDLLRLVIETRKDQMAKLPWVIRVKDNPNTDVDEATLHDARCKELEQFFAFPDKEHGWDTWLRMLLEDLLVIDAPTAYIRKTKGGQVYAVEPIDGATIKRVLDVRGRTPTEPDPAYQQVLKGLPAVDYTRQELLYLPRNPRTHKVYGYSPVEQIITTVNIALRRQAHQLGFYTDGSTPDLVFQVPAEWSPTQIKQFEDYWNNLLSGNVHERRRTRFVPAGVAPFDTKDKAMKDEYDEWLARVVCFAFSISPQAFVKEMNRATAQTAQEAALSEGLAPLMQWVKGLMDRIIQQVFGFTDIEFKWDTQESIKPKEQAEIDQIYINSKVVHPDEIRADRFNLKPMDAELRESMSPAPIMQNDDDADQASEDKSKAKDTEKFAKAKKSIAPINRDRESVAQARQTLQQQLETFLQDQAQDIALQVIAQRDTLGKVINIQDLVSDMLDKVSFGAWVSITNWFNKSTESVALDGVQTALDQLNVQLSDDALKLANAQAVDFAKDRAAELVGMRYQDGELVQNPNPKFTITESTREMLRSKVTNALEDGWSNDRLADEFKKDYAFSAARAEMIARTETAIADIQGNMYVYDQTGLVEGKEWLTAPDCCPKCNELNGKIVALHATFVEGGYFKDPPLHPHCRCDVLPVLIERIHKDLVA